MPARRGHRVGVTGSGFPRYWATAVSVPGAAICWENTMPLLRAAVCAKGVELWCDPTVDDREAWLASMRHVADDFETRPRRQRVWRP